MQGKIQLSLRNPLDTKQDEVASANSRGLYKGVAEPPPVSQPVVHHNKAEKKTAPPPVGSTGVSIEVYPGDKKSEEVKCTEEGCTSK